MYDFKRGMVTDNEFLAFNLDPRSHTQKKPEQKTTTRREANFTEGIPLMVANTLLGTLLSGRVVL